MAGDGVNLVKAWGLHVQETIKEEERGQSKNRVQEGELDGKDKIIGSQVLKKGILGTQMYSGSKRVGFTQTQQFGLAPF